MKFSILLPDFRHPEVAAHDADRLHAVRAMPGAGRLRVRRALLRACALLRLRLQPR
ncbi:hypothetical protein [Cupriavidus sp. IDO]|uniref:hypothetical protein n=1 Tax=Cupriavidus sp. IDO TaxID=1539142 RepID=UPI000B148C59|nr:hypothetical protein [Cupriavidus sp. IDO]